MKRYNLLTVRMLIKRRVFRQSDGIGDIASFIGTNSGTTPVTATITVTPTLAGCTGDAETFTIIVNPLPIIDAGTDDVICEGTSVTLSGSGAGTNGAYTWDNGITDGVTFTPAVGNVTYTVVGTDENGCENTDQVSVLVHPMPVYTLDSHNPETCGGTEGTITLSGLTPGETYNVSYDNNGTTVGPTALTVDANGNIVLTGLTAGTYDNFNVEQNDCNTPDNTVITLVDPDAPMVNAINGQELCHDATVNAVNFSGTTGTTFNWTNNTTSIGLAANGIGDIASFIGTNSGTTPATATITVTPTLVGCTGESETFTITVNPLPIIDAGTDDVICEGTSVTLAGSGAGTNGAYTWDNGITDGVTFTPAVGNVTYTVVGTDENGCENTDQVSVLVHPMPVYTIDSHNPETCGGTEGTITLIGLTPGETYNVTLEQAGTTYSTNPNSMTADANGNIVITGLTAGIYTDFIVEQNDCYILNETIIELVDPDAPIVNAINGQELCHDATVNAVNFSGTAGATFNWTNDNTSIGLGVNGTGNITSFTGTNTGNTPITATITVTPHYVGCIGESETFTIIVNPLPIIDAGVDNMICEGSSIILSGNGAGPGGTYTWNNGITNATSFTPNVGTMTYTVIGTDINGCQNTDNISITVHPMPEVDFSADNTIGCSPLEVILTNNSTGNLVNCTWTFSDGSSITSCGTVQKEFVDVGCYSVSLTVESDQGCVNTVSKTSFICVAPDPIADFDVNPEELSNIQPTADMINLSSGATNFEWTFGDGGSSNHHSPSHTYADEESNDFIITLIAISDVGCSDTISRLISLKEELLYYIPNTFTPDNDNYNEYFKPIFTSGFDPENYHLSIYNRWGEILFESYNHNYGWDGTYGGKIVQDGTYVWKITFKVKENDKFIEEVGSINLIR